MDSMYELVDPSHLVYDVDLGFTGFADQGQGPPQNQAGWIRTGAPGVTTELAGVSNCGAYTSDSNSHYGTTWELGFADPAALWIDDTAFCGSSQRVWCASNPQ